MAKTKKRARSKSSKGKGRKKKKKSKPSPQELPSWRHKSFLRVVARTYQSLIDKGEKHGIRPRASIEEEPCSSETILEVLDSFTRHEERDTTIKINNDHFERLVSASKSKFGPPQNLDVPALSVADVYDLLREPVGDERCCSRAKCFAHRVENWEGESLRALPFVKDVDICLVCHDMLVDLYRLIVVSHHDSRRSFDMGEDGAPSLRVNACTYVCGKGGYKPEMLVTGASAGPVPGILGCLLTPNLGQLTWYTDSDGVKRIDDSSRHFW